MKSLNNVGKESSTVGNIECGTYNKCLIPASLWKVNTITWTVNITFLLHSTANSESVLTSNRWDNKEEEQKGVNITNGEISFSVHKLKEEFLCLFFLLWIVKALFSYICWITRRIFVPKILSQKLNKVLYKTRFHFGDSQNIKFKLFCF